MNTRPIRTARKLLGAAVLSIGVLAGMTAFNPVPAHAAVSSSVENISSHTTCYTGTRTAYMNASLMLNQARFPNGAYVSNRYRYYWVNTSGYRTSPIYATAYGPARFVDTSSTVYDAVGSPMTANNPTPLPGTTVAGTGKIHVIYDVAVWNGRAYEYTSIQPSTYKTYYYGSYGGTSAVNSFCQLSW